MIIIRVDRRMHENVVGTQLVRVRAALDGVKEAGRTDSDDEGGQ
jgi:hypothetical protein